MEHADVLEQIELAAVERDGLARLAAGDTPDAAAVAGHLAGCPDCTAELERTVRTAGIARDVIRELPDPALKERTLAYVRTVGVDRSTQAAVGASAGGTSPGVPSPTPADAPAVVVPLASRQTRRTPWWAAASIAAVVVAGVAGFAAGGAASTPPLGPDVATVMSAAKVTMHIAEQPDAAHYPLTSTTGERSGGTILYSPATGEVSMTATGLKPVPAGAVYDCWVEVDGQRRRIGILYVDGSDGTWAGNVADVGNLGPNPVFGVSLVKPGDSGGTQVLRGGG